MILPDLFSNVAWSAEGQRAKWGFKCMQVTRTNTFHKPSSFRVTTIREHLAIWEPTPSANFSVLHSLVCDPLAIVAYLSKLPPVSSSKSLSQHLYFSSPLFIVINALVVCLCGHRPSQIKLEDCSTSSEATVQPVRTLWPWLSGKECRDPSPLSIFSSRLTDLSFSRFLTLSLP